MRKLILLLVAALLLASGCQMSAAPVVAPVATSTQAPVAPSSCHLRGAGEMALPDARCTPGVTNPEVSQGNMAQTICQRGWTRTIRPPVTYTDALKRQQMATYSEAGTRRQYEEDHLIPLELGGAPSDPANLWPEPGASPNPKDRVENALNQAVCGGQMLLAAAQRAIATDWITAGRQLGAL